MDHGITRYTDAHQMLPIPEMASFDGYLEFKWYSRLAESVFCGKQLFTDIPLRRADLLQHNRIIISEKPAFVIQLPVMRQYPAGDKYPAATLEAAPLRVG